MHHHRSTPSTHISAHTSTTEKTECKKGKTHRQAGTNSGYLIKSPTASAVTSNLNQYRTSRLTIHAASISHAHVARDAKNVSSNVYGSSRSLNEKYGYTYTPR